MTEFIIEDNVPVPARRRVGGGGRKYPWLELSVGQSFFVKNPPKIKNGYFVPLVAAPNKRYAPKKFISRKEGDGLRVWRVE